MADPSTPFRALYTNATTDYQGLALELFWGEVFGMFRQKTYFFDRIRRKTITSGKSWQFIRYGDSQADDAPAPGTELLGNPFGFDEGIVTVDDTIVAHHDVAVDDEDLAHFDIRSPVSFKMGEAIALKYDKRVAQLALLGARTAARTITLSDTSTKQIHPGGFLQKRTAANIATAYPLSTTGSQNLQSDLAAIAQAWDERNIPEDGRMAYLTPYLVRVLLLDKSLVNKYYTSNPGDQNRRIITEVEGWQITKCNSIPSTNIATGPTKYQGDFSTTAGLCMRDGALGGVQARGLAATIMPDARRRTTFMKAEIRCGFGVIMPEECAELSIAA